MKNKITNLKTIFAAALLIASSVSTNAQTWNTTGNAGLNPATNFIGTTDNKHFRIRTNNQVRLTVDSAGRVGIGTQTPGFLFEISNTTSTSYASRIYSGVSSAGNIEAAYTGARNIGAGGAVAARFETTGAGGGNNTGLIAYAQDGATNYGISSGVLTSTNQIGYGIYASSTGAGSTNYGVRAIATGSAFYNYGVYAEASGGTNNYAGCFMGKIYTSDRLLIGTTNTSAKLNLYNTDTATNSFKVYANGNNRLIVDGKGRVMIGTATPANGYALSVKGKVMCEELKVELSASWPDYVFANDYKLKTLEEVEQHISQYKHLPGIPAAAEMEANGISVGEMQTKLVEKVEELTLYIIQLKKEIETLKNK